MLDLDILGTLGATQEGGDLVCNPQHRLELLAEDLDGNVAAHPRDQFVETPLNRLGEFIGIAGQTSQSLL